MGRSEEFVPFAEALRRLDWLATDAALETSVSANKTLQSDCWLRRWLDGPVQPGLKLNACGRRQVQRLVAAGWSLRSCWPRVWQATVAEWLGSRIYLGHASHFSSQVRYYSLVSSRIGRHGRQHPQWPQWIDGVLRHMKRYRGRLLLAPGSTLTESLEQFATTAQLPLTHIGWNESGDVASWFQAMLASLCSHQDGTVAALDDLHLSPVLEPPSGTLAAIPLQDRIAMALSDRVWAMSLRQGGKLEKLVRMRLAEPSFPSGSLFVTLPRAIPSPGSQSPKPPASRPSASESWLTQGAVGWIVVEHASRQAEPLQHCHHQDLRPVTAQQVTAQQLTVPLPHRWRALSAADDWPYLVHCTRGTSGRMLEESEVSFRQRVWSQGEVRGWHPLETLAHICREGRLRGTAAMTRTAEHCVSFSAVPLVPLLQRRVFRQHLGHWDWEPYGLLIRRTSLQALGARQVIYGAEDDFAQLSTQDKPLFQPRGRKLPSEPWSAEREWRVLNDVELQSLRAASVLIFVRTQREAQQFSRYSPWPVLWVE